MKNLIFVDTETTGLDPTWHEIIDVWVAEVDPQTIEIITEKGDLIKPLHIERATTKALHVNQYCPERWKKAKDAKEVLATIMPLINNGIWVGQYTQFDIDFVEKACQNNNIEFVYPENVLDIRDITKTFLKNVKLDAVCERLGIDSMKLCGLPPHTAKADVYRIIEVYKIMQSFTGTRGYYARKKTIAT